MCSFPNSQSRIQQLISTVIARSFVGALAMCTASLAPRAQQASPVTQAAVNSVDDRLYEIASLFANIHIADIDATVSVFTNTRKSRFFMVPVLLADWSAFRALVTALPDDDPQTHSVPMRLVLRDPKIQDKVFQAIQSDTTTTLKPHHLNVVPHAFYRIEAMVGGRRQILVTSKNLEELESGITAIAETNLQSQIRVSVEGTKAELDAFAAAAGSPDTLTGKLYSKGHAVKASALSINLKALFESSGHRALFRQEQLERKNKVETQGKNSGFSINMGIGSFNKNKNGQRIETTVSQKRLITEQFLSNLFDERDYVINIRETGDMADAKKQVMGWMLNQMDEARLEFVRMKQGAWLLGNKEIGYTQLNGAQIKSVMSAKPKVDSSLENTNTATMPNGQSASNTRKSTNNYANELQWELDDKGVYIPTSVNMKILDEQKLRMALTMSWERAVVAERPTAFVQHFVTPTSRDLERTMPMGPLATRLDLVDQRVADIGTYLVRLPEALKIKTGLGSQGCGPPSFASNGAWTAWSQHPTTLLKVLVELTFPVFKFKK